MIIWQVYDFYDQSHTRTRYYTYAEAAVKFFFDINQLWAEPCIKAWDADYDGSQGLLFAHNGSVIKRVAGKPNVRYTCEHLTSLVNKAMEKKSK